MRTVAASTSNSCADAPHPSPLTPHPSPLTPHPSLLTPHPSPLTLEGAHARGGQVQGLGQ